MSTSAASRREADATRPVKTVFLRRGTATRVHHHQDEASWTHVVSGDLLDERWRRDERGQLVHEKRVLRERQVVAAPGQTLHRVLALTDVAFVTSCTEDCTCARHATEELLPDPAAQTHGDVCAMITAVGERVAASLGADDSLPDADL